MNELNGCFGHLFYIRQYESPISYLFNSYLV